MAAPLILSVIHYLVCALGTVFNVATLAIIAMQTPTNLTCYAATLFSQTLLLMLTCLTSGVHFARVIPNGVSTFVVSSGPVHLLRYYAFIRAAPRFRTVLVILVIMYLPTVLIFTWAASSATLLDETTSKAVLAQRGPHYLFEEDVLVVGILNVLEPCNFTAIFLVCVLWIPCYAIIIVTGLLLYRTLAAHLSIMSEKTRLLHRDIVRGLVIQACLPVMYGISALMFAIGQYNNRSLVEIEYLTHMAGEICLMLTPLTTLFFVQPYRHTIAQIFIKKIAIAPQSFYTTMNED